MPSRNKYEFKHCQPTIEHFLQEFKDKDVKICIPGSENLSAFINWATNYCNSCTIQHENIDFCDITYINETVKPYELMKIICKGFDALHKGGYMIINHFFDNKPDDDFEKNPRYAIDAFCFLTQFDIDILFKGNQIIIKKL